MKTQEERGSFDPLPYVAKILREKLLMEQRGLATFEKNITSEDFFTRRQAEGSLPSNRHRMMELEEALEFLKSYKKSKPGEVKTA